MSDEVCTELVFTRPWCVGEMCVARLKGVNVTLVALPGHVLPDEIFIAEVCERVTDLEVPAEDGRCEPPPSALFLRAVLLGEYDIPETRTQKNTLHQRMPWGGWKEKGT